MGLFPAVLDEAKQKGIDLAPKTIPPEVFDKRAVEKGQVRFHDVAYIEATPRFDKKDKLTARRRVDRFLRLLLARSRRRHRRRSEGRQKRSRLRTGQAHQTEQRQRRRHHPRRADQAMDGLGGLLGGGLRLREPQGNHQSRQAAWAWKAHLPGIVELPAEFIDFEERWTGAYIFENEWQSFRTRQNRDLELTTAPHTYDKPGRYIRRRQSDRHLRQRHHDARAGDRRLTGFMSTFDSTKTELGKLLGEIIEGELQLPDFQRGWVWDDEHIRSLLVSIARSFPIGAVMLLETGGDTRFQVRPVEGVALAEGKEPERLILDGQQRLTSLTQVLKLRSPVSTKDENKREVKRFYYFDIERALAGPQALEDAIIGVAGDRLQRANFGRDVVLDPARRKNSTKHSISLATKSSTPIPGRMG